ncbi:hypothetical protein BDQ17DRAFT_1410496 [Cyathus striatus]|nr:hypothetical protein BDQ17DRAFT_1550162 [Cyathus striatus]KAF8999941.1 hypothetical protein BDQ17DRAFT_1410496 [Cyathus striatus]
MSLNNFRVPDNRENMGIVDGRPEGRQPAPAKVTMDTVFDKDASATEPLDTTAQFNGATSKDVYESAGRPGSDFTNSNGEWSKHNKKEHSGASQWGTPRAKDVAQDRAGRPTGADTGAARRG